MSQTGLKTTKKSDVPAGSAAPQRLHPGTLIVPLLSNLTKLIIPAFLMTFWMNQGAWLLLGALNLILPLAAYHVLRFLSFTYQLRDTELFIRSGILWKSERRIPLSRIQDSKSHQGIFHQLVGVVRLDITTAASEEQEASLNVISRKEAARLRSALQAFQGKAEEVEGQGSAPGSEPESLLRLSNSELLLGGLTSRLVGTVFALAGAAIYFGLVLSLFGKYARVFDSRFFRWEEYVVPDRAGWGGLLHSLLAWQDTFVGSILLVLGWLLLGLFRFIVQYYRFQLADEGDVLHQSYGLFTLRGSSIPRDRVQALKVEESFLRRWAGYATVWADSGGDRGNSEEDPNKERDPLVPIVTRARALELVQSVLPNLAGAEPQWERVSSKAIARGTRVGCLILLLVTLQTTLALGWFGLVWLPLFPLIYYVNLKLYQNRGYWIDQHYLISRKGWFNRETLYLPVRNLQMVELTQNPFDRRLGLASLIFDVAGQANTGGGATIRNLPEDEARELQQRLAHRVSQLPI